MNNIPLENISAFVRKGIYLLSNAFPFGIHLLSLQEVRRCNKAHFRSGNDGKSRRQ